VFDALNPIHCKQPWTSPYRMAKLVNYFSQFPRTFRL